MVEVGVETMGDQVEDSQVKRGTIEHPKTLRLARLLAVPRWGAVGLLESLWHFTAKHAMAGDIGKWSDEEIASSLAWDGDASVLISALVKAGLVNESPTHRLVVHDWSEHADDSVRKTLRNRKMSFADVSGTFATFPENSGNGSPKPEPEPSQARAKPEPSPACACVDFEKLRTLLPLQFQGPRTESAMRRWFGWCTKHGKPPFDPDEQAVRLIQLFETEDALVESIKTAIGNGWTTLKNYAAPKAKKPSDEGGLKPFKVHREPTQ